MESLKVNFPVSFQQFLIVEKVQDVGSYVLYFWWKQDTEKNKTKQHRHLSRVFKNKHIHFVNNFFLKT